NRAAIMRGNLPRVAFQFQTYVFEMLHLYTNAYSRAFLDNPTLSAEEKQQAKREIRNLMVSQLAVGGIMGLPLIGSAGALTLTLMSPLIDDDEEESWDTFARNTIRDVVDVFFEPGSDINEVTYLALSRGIFDAVSSVAGAGGSYGQRLSLADVLFRPDPFAEGYEESLDSFMLSMFGPAGSIGSSLARAADHIADDRVDKAVETFMPSALRNVFLAGKYAWQGGVLTSKGDLVTDLNAAELLTQAVGVSPARKTQQILTNGDFYKRRDKVKDARSLLLTEAFALWENDATSEAWNDWWAEADRLSEKYPGLAITEKTVLQSRKAKLRSKDKAVNGVVEMNDEFAEQLNQYYRNRN
ncbi:MAG: PLxRFG domain-containing protein, partial [Pseudomonadota bacterium]